jgi:hypothetical protein
VIENIKIKFEDWIRSKAVLPVEIIENRLEVIVI